MRMPALHLSCRCFLEALRCALVGFQFRHIVIQSALSAYAHAALLAILPCPKCAIHCPQVESVPLRQPSDLPRNVQIEIYVVVRSRFRPSERTYTRISRIGKSSGRIHCNNADAVHNPTPRNCLSARIQCSLIGCGKRARSSYPNSGFVIRLVVRRLTLRFPSDQV